MPDTGNLIDEDEDSDDPLVEKQRNYIVPLLWVAVAVVVILLLLSFFAPWVSFLL